MEINAEAAVKKLMQGVVPERASEMIHYFEDYSPHFALNDDRPGFVIEAGPFGILKFTHRTMLQMWLLGFAAKKALHSYSSLIAYLRISDTNFEAKLVNDIEGQKEADNEYNELILAIYELAAASTLKSFGWPEEVPNPERGKPTDIEDALVFDLNCMATAYVFLHEMKHIAYSLDGNRPSNPLEEELGCDAFAREIMMDRLQDYAQESGYPLDMLKTKRATSVALASFYMLVITREELWGGSESHPSMADRITAIVADLNLPDNDIFWIYLGSILLSQLRYTRKMPTGIPFRSIRELCYSLIKCVKSASNNAINTDS